MPAPHSLAALTTSQTCFSTHPAHHKPHHTHNSHAKTREQKIAFFFFFSSPTRSVRGSSSRTPRRNTTNTDRHKNTRCHSPKRPSNSKRIVILLPRRVFEKNSLRLSFLIGSRRTTAEARHSSSRTRSDQLNKRVSDQANKKWENSLIFFARARRDDVSSRESLICASRICGPKHNIQLHAHRTQQSRQITLVALYLRHAQQCRHISRPVNKTTRSRTREKKKKKKKKSFFAHFFLSSFRLTRQRHDQQKARLKVGYTTTTRSVSHHSSPFQPPLTNTRLAAHAVGSGARLRVQHALVALARHKLSLGRRQKRRNKNDNFHL